ncbi:hypothetical protein M409DRAFT_27350 [Zasmidium cellare ATCC 36951]|uniref:Uncharacterized protein n=1 Tax=Zasmidium cellare ATCC 36951 TaxID=1080233 RepID=A0A6A6CA67_ZASCE|nr:uncharacterized protein M409DRAFT_27350 [Zasmidium cellare ATCC 36951]KAF2162346.1 hypothetical protein M409DRAFT_27350 [Zasmidium cellare ATCC 36951]
MTRLSIRWTKPAAKKLRKQNIPSATNPENGSRSNVVSRLDERLDNHDGWSLVSSTGSSPVPEEESVEVLDEARPGPPANNSATSHIQQDSGSPTWSLVEAEQAREQESPELDYDDCLVHPDLTTLDEGQRELDRDESLTSPYITVDPSTPSNQNPSSDKPYYHRQKPLPAHLVDYRGARSYWANPVDLNDLGEQIKQLKISYRNLSGASRELFKKQEKQLSELQNTRWEIEASRDEVEKHVEELNSDKASVQDIELRSRVSPAPLKIDRTRDSTFDYDDKTRSFLADFNARERAVFSTVGRYAQRKRSNLTPCKPQPRSIEHVTSNSRKDFPYKTGTFIHRDVQPIYDHKGMRVGWNHKHMPSYKRPQPTPKTYTRDETLIEIGKLPVSERMEALFNCQKFKQAVSTTDKKRKRQTRWYTERTMANLLWTGGVARDNRHDSVLGEV